MNFNIPSIEAIPFLTGFIAGFTTYALASQRQRTTLAPRPQKAGKSPQKTAEILIQVLDVPAFTERQLRSAYAELGGEYSPDQSSDFDHELKLALVDLGKIRLAPERMDHWLSKGSLPRLIRVDDRELSRLTRIARNRFKCILVGVTYDRES